MRNLIDLQNFKKMKLMEKYSLNENVKCSPEVDRILDKILDSGYDSLTSAEIKALDNASCSKFDVEKTEKYKDNITSVNKTMRFSLDKTENVDSNIIHYGILEVNGMLFNGQIICDDDGNFAKAEFNLTTPDKKFKYGEDLFHVFVDMKYDIEDFLEQDVCEKIK